MNQWERMAGAAVIAASGCAHSPSDTTPTTDACRSALQYEEAAREEYSGLCTNWYQGPIQTCGPIEDRRHECATLSNTLIKAVAARSAACKPPAPPITMLPQR